ncbi:MAG: hypothetical protein K6T83_21875 [Alicyclobacillus sp.]|nr:hypothetical protein [Alicyclobacillus sp.]
MASTTPVITTLDFTEIEQIQSALTIQKLPDGAQDQLIKYCNQCKIDFSRPLYSKLESDSGNIYYVSYPIDGAPDSYLILTLDSELQIQGYQLILTEKIDSDEYHVLMIDNGKVMLDTSMSRPEISSSSKTPEQGQFKPHIDWNSVFCSLVMYAAGTYSCTALSLINPAVGVICSAIYGIGGSFACGTV